MAKTHRSVKKQLHTPISLEKAKRMTQKTPKNPEGWSLLGRLLIQQKRYQEAQEALRHALELSPSALIHERLGFAAYCLNDTETAKSHAEIALEHDPEHVAALLLLTGYYLDQSRPDKALEYVLQAEIQSPDNPRVLEQKVAALNQLNRFDEAMKLADRLTELEPDHFLHWNSAANNRRELGLLDEVDYFYREGIKRAGQNTTVYSNRITFLHYHPEVSREEIFAATQEWQERFAPADPPPRPVPNDLTPTRRLRVGMFSDGFRNHPVGTMIVSAIEQLSTQDVEIFAYPTHNDVDPITKRIQAAVDHWVPIKRLNDAQFAQRVRDDGIDILIDLAGHNAGTRSIAMAMQPAPLQVKWVGGLINTTGVAAMDYLISDSIETPPGSDDFYTEKLIRMPDDYIVFSPPPHTPPLSPLPAQKNGYITLGCFNNPTKLNPVLLKEWAELMKQLPDSRLFLKGKPYTSTAFCERIYQLMEEQGIERERLIIEGPASHRDLMAAYNRVDIALDPWPYSGGLTTCEAFIMGVPVVTLPGQTFAGRHSATHLVNAGMPELVVTSWEEYRERVVELASDIDSLATIRQHLRQVLLQSPVCDGPRLGKHLMMSLRAIWQRYCEGKAPEALTFNKQGQAWFEDDLQPLELSIAAPDRVKRPKGFDWELSGKIVTLDNGSKLLRNKGLQTLLKLNAFALVAFDPRSSIAQPERFEGHSDIQLFQHVTLGDGQPSTLHACLDPDMSSSLKPLPTAQADHSGLQVLTKLPINTITLDSIEGLESLDWLVLDDLNDSVAILENGVKALKDTLVIEARIVFQPTHERQPNIAELSHWASRHGFRFYRFHTLHHQSRFPKRDDIKNNQSTELMSALALFIPSKERVSGLGDDQRTKLAFLLNTIYGIRDMSYELLASVDKDKAEEYLIEEGVVEDADKEAPAVETPEIPAHEAQEFPLPEAPFMSPAERSLFKKGLKNAKHYFEFGSGGSTVWAVKEGLTVKGVESDAKWVNALKNKLGEKCEVEAVDIGPTKEWGFPVSIQQASRFPAYSKAIHHHAQEFDFILVDGRFRVACAMAAIQHVLEHSKEPQEARIFIHDFWDRPQYHAVLEFLDVVEKAETAGVFKLKTDLKAEAISETWEKFSLQPN